MKILVIAHGHPDFSVGGAELAAFNLYGALKDRADVNEITFLARTDHASLAPGAIALTAACMLMRRDTFDAVGGFDEGFLIGDFEDSDLCLKVSARDLELICLSDVNLVHLERQSFTGIGADGFRERVARYNAWRHQRRWADTIKTLVSQS